MVLHCWLFIQIVVTQGLSFIHIVEVELYSGLLMALADGWFSNSAANIKTNEYVIIIEITTTAIAQ